MTRTGPIFVGLDTETHIFRRGYATPRAVCMSVASRRLGDVLIDLRGTGDHQHVVYGYDEHDPTIEWAVFDRVGAAWAYRELIENPDAHVVIHNSDFDLRVSMALAPHTVDATFIAVDEGRVWDTQHREKLMALSVGELRFRRNAFAESGSKHTPTEVNLAELAMRYCGIDIRESKKSDSRRLRYAELDGVPIHEWPQDAIDYSAMDAVLDLRILEAQNAAQDDSIEGFDAFDDAPAVNGIRRLAGEHFEANGIGGGETRAGPALGLMGGWGLRTEAEAVERTLAEWQRMSDAGKAIGERLGFIRKTRQGSGKIGTVNQTALRALVARAYGGEVRTCPDCEGRGFRPPTGRQRVNQGCKTCKWSGLIVDSLGKGTPLTDTGMVSLSEENIDGCGDAEMIDYAKSLQATNWLGKYGPVLKSGTFGPVTYSANTLVSTGRTSVKNPPMQQPPREGGFRECFVPRKGRLFAAADYSQLELRTLAQVQKWWGLGDTLLQAFCDGMDPHVMMAVDILNAEGHPWPSNCHDTAWNYELAVSCLQGCFDPPPDDLPVSQYPPGVLSWRKVIKTYRQMAKAANFGFPGGLGPKAFVAYAKGTYRVVITEEKAAELRDLWHQRWPEMAGYFDKINTFLGWADKFTACQPISRRIRGGCGYCDGANTYFQGSAADGFKAAAWALQVECWTGARVERVRELRQGDYPNTALRRAIAELREGKGPGPSPLYGSRPVLPLHDEFVVEVPEARAADAAERLAHVMVYTMGHYFPDVPIEAEPALMRRWYKGAETRRDGEGRLIPWEPN